MGTASEVKFGVHSEVGQLRKVMVCAPGRAHQRLTPSNCDALLFDDVLWVENAKRDHFDFVSKMRDRGVDVVEMHNLLAETVAVPEGKKWILDNQVVPNQVGLGFVERAQAATSMGCDNRDLAETLIGGLSTHRLSRSATAARRSRSSGGRRRHRVSAAAAAEHPLHARHDLLDLRRRDAQRAVLAGAARGDDPDDRDLQVPSGLRGQGQRLVGRPDSRTTGWRRWKAAT